MKKIFLFLILVSGWSNYLLGGEVGEGGEGDEPIVQDLGGGFAGNTNEPVPGGPYLLGEQLGITAISSSPLYDLTPDFASPTSDPTQSDLLFKTIQRSIEETLRLFNKDNDIIELKAELDKIPNNKLETLDFSKKLDVSTIRELEEKFVEILKSNEAKDDKIRNSYRKNVVKELIKNLRKLVKEYNEKDSQERKDFLEGELRKLGSGSSNRCGPDCLSVISSILALIVGAIVNAIKSK